MKMCANWRELVNAYSLQPEPFCFSDEWLKGKRAAYAIFTDWLYNRPPSTSAKPYRIHSSNRFSIGCSITACSSPVIDCIVISIDIALLSFAVNKSPIETKLVCAIVVRTRFWLNALAFYCSNSLSLVSNVDASTGRCLSALVDCSMVVVLPLQTPLPHTQQVSTQCVRPSIQDKKRSQHEHAYRTLQIQIHPQNDRWDLCTGDRDPIRNISRCPNTRTKRREKRTQYRFHWICSLHSSRVVRGAFTTWEHREVWMSNSTFRTNISLVHGTASTSFELHCVRMLCDDYICGIKRTRDISCARQISKPMKFVGRCHCAEQQNRELLFFYTHYSFITFVLLHTIRACAW